MPDTIPTSNAGPEWLACLEYSGRGATDPIGGSLPEGWGIIDLVLSVKVKRGKKIIEASEPKPGDLIIKAIMDEDTIQELYDQDPRAILLGQASGRADLTRLEWYEKFGRDGLRTWATSALKRPARQPFNITGIGNR
jgi:hypothetical protein